MDKAAILTAITAAFRKEFQTGIESVKPSYQTIAMTVPSTTAINTYGWLGKFPKMREWVGERQIEKMATEAMSIANKNTKRPLVWSAPISKTIRSACIAR
nr:Mu-like prophage major head subunit gpT family protein [Neisseria sp. N177_16]